MTTPSIFTEAAKSLEFLVFEAETESAADASLTWSRTGLTVRTLRGRKMVDYDGLMNEVGAALQFPYYFGENYGALAECLGDLDWLPFSPGIVILIDNAGDALTDDDSVELPAFIRALANASEELNKPIERGEWWDRPAWPFHVVLRCAPDESEGVTERWRRAGATVVPLPIVNADET